MHQHQDRVFSYAMHMLSDRAAAADVTQDVFVKLWERWVDMDPDRTSSWLLRVTRNACIDVIRKRKVRNVQPESDAFSLDHIPTDSQGPDRDAAASLFRERLAAALETLGEPHKSIVILREVQEYKYEEIGEILDLPLNTVKVYLHRARKALRKELTETMRYDYA